MIFKFLNRFNPKKITFLNSIWYPEKKLNQLSQRIEKYLKHNQLSNNLYINLFSYLIKKQADIKILISETNQKDFKSWPIEDKHRFLQETQRNITQSILSFWWLEYWVLGTLNQNHIQQGTVLSEAPIDCSGKSLFFFFLTQCDIFVVELLIALQFPLLIDELPLIIDFLTTLKTQPLNDQYQQMVAKTEEYIYLQFHQPLDTQLNLPPML